MNPGKVHIQALQCRSLSWLHWHQGDNRAYRLSNGTPRKPWICKSTVTPQTAYLQQACLRSESGSQPCYPAARKDEMTTVTRLALTMSRSSIRLSLISPQPLCKGRHPLCVHLPLSTQVSGLLNFSITTVLSSRLRQSAVF